jgi:very-short-patch-repair endonuclease
LAKRIGKGARGMDHRIKKIMHYKKYETAKLYARELRKDSTPAEAIFWDIVKRIQFHGNKC